MEVNILLVVYNIIAQLVVLYQSISTHNKLKKIAPKDNIQKVMEWTSTVGISYLLYNLGVLVIWLYVFLVIGLANLYFPIMGVLIVGAIIKTALIILRFKLFRDLKKEVKRKQNDN